MSARGGHWLMVAAVILVAGAIAAAVAVMDPPTRQRAERMDARRVEDLQELARRLDAHFDAHAQLPAQLSVVADGPGRDVVDPGTGRPYAYEVTGDRAYRLCATFETDGGDPGHPVPPHYDWRHDAGRQCFAREVQDVVRPGIAVPARPAPPAES